MKIPPDPDVAAIFQGLSDTVRADGARFCMQIKSGNGQDFETSLRRHDLSAHQLLVMMQHARSLEEVLRRLPLVGECHLPVFALISTERKYNHRTPLEFVIQIADFNITKPASPRWRTAAEMLSRTRARLGEVKAACDAPAKPPSSWLVQAKSRIDRIVPARSAREAAWLYSALYLRNRKEIDTWKDAPADIRRVSEIAPDQTWRDLEQP